jgi:ABC-type uncharacterized transport system involved in gliding motility auxiliary subunit
MYTISVPYPFWVKIAKENFDQQNPIVSQLESLVLPWASPLEIVKEKNGATSVELRHNEKGYKCYHLMK